MRKLWFVFLFSLIGMFPLWGVWTGSKQDLLDVIKKHPAGEEAKKELLEYFNKHPKGEGVEQKIAEYLKKHSVWKETESILLDFLKKNPVKGDLGEKVADKELSKKEEEFCTALYQLVPTATEANVGSPDSALTEKREKAVKTIKLLINAGVNPGIGCKFQKAELTAFDLAIWHGNKDLVEFLIIAGIDVNAQNDKGRTFLHDAVERGDIDIVKLLLENGAKTVINVKDLEGRTPISLAFRRCCKRMPMINLLFLNGADLFTVDQYGITLLHLACFQRDEELVNFLLKNKLPIDPVDKDGYTPLLRLISAHFGGKNTQGLIKRLVELGASVKVKGNDGKNVIHPLAFDEENKDLIAFFVDKGVDINDADNQGQTPLHNAASSPFSKELCEFLLDQGASMSLRDKRGETPFYQVVSAGEYETIELFIKRGAKKFDLFDAEGERADGSSSDDKKIRELLKKLPEDEKEEKEILEFLKKVSEDKKKQELEDKKKRELAKLNKKPLKKPTPPQFDVVPMSSEISYAYPQSLK